MSVRAAATEKVERILLDNPLEEVIEGFYKPRQKAERERSGPVVAKPTHYKIVCISLYVEDIERLERLVGELKKRGHTKANKSQLIRAALDQVDIAKIPKGY